jgi:hypothetical protein
VVAWIATHFDDADEVVHAIDPIPASRRDLVARVRQTMPGARVLWFPSPLLTLASWGAIAAQKLMRPRKPAVSVKAAFSAPRCETDRVRAVLDVMDESAETLPAESRL